MTWNLRRQEALRGLVELRNTVGDALARLSELEWSSEQELVTLVVGDVARAIDRYETGLLREDELSAWAEAVHGREDVALDPADRDLLADALYELSTPELFGAMTEVVQALKARLS